MKQNLGLLDKRGQVTIFIIIAVVIVAIILLFLYLNTQSEKEDLEEQFDKVITVDARFQGIYSSVNSQFKDIVEEGLEILRLQGGYIYFPSNIETAKVYTESKRVEQINGEPVLIEESGFTEIPKWIKKNSLAVPSKEFMKKELEIYIKKELEKIDWNSYISDDFAKIEPKSINVEVGLNNFVSVSVDWPVNFYTDTLDHTLGIEEFYTYYSIDFEKLYSALYNIAAYELGYNYLEHHVNSLVSLYSYSGGEKGNSLPPISFIIPNNDCSYVSWNNNEVKSLLERILEQNFRYLHMEKTLFENEETSKVYESFIHPYFIFDDVDGISIDYSYSTKNKLDLSIDPNNLMPERTSRGGMMFMPIFCILDYEFYYDISGSVITRVNDVNNQRFAPGGYIFYFPMDFNICQNEADKCPDYSHKEINLDEWENALDIKILDCNSQGGDGVLDVVDGNGEDMDQVGVEFYCEGMEGFCYLGEFNSRDSIGLPECIGKSIFSVNKNGFGGGVGGVDETIILHGIHEFDVGNVYLIDANDFAGVYQATNGFTTDYCGGSSVGALDRISVNPRADLDNTMIIFDGAYDSFISYPEVSSFNLTAGAYDVSFVNNGEVSIDPVYYEGAGWVGLNTDNPTIPYEGDWILGSTKFSYVFEENEIGDKEIVDFYTLVDFLPQDYIDIDSVSKTLLSKDGISGDVYFDLDCDSVDDIISVSLTNEEIKEVLKPRFK